MSVWFKDETAREYVDRKARETGKPAHLVAWNAYMTCTDTRARDELCDIYVFEKDRIESQTNAIALREFLG